MHPLFHTLPFLVCFATGLTLAQFAFSDLRTGVALRDLGWRAPAVTALAFAAALVSARPLLEWLLQGAA